MSGSYQENTASAEVRDHTRTLNVRFLTLAILVAFLYLISGVSAQTCTCDNTDTKVCVNGNTGNGHQDFSIELLSYDVNQLSGKREFVYKICRNNPTDTFCPTLPNHKDMSHVDLLIADITPCASTAVSVEVSSPSSVSCTIDVKDPSCGVTSFKVIKCTPGTFNPPDCFQITVSIGGETTTVLPGPVYTLTKAGPDCAQACILGPSCTACLTDAPTVEGSELTRSPGFYANHPTITTKYLPISACGITFDHFGPSPAQGSVSQALCINSRSSYRKVSGTDYNRDVLLRQLVAASLNIKVTNYYGGTISSAHTSVYNSCNNLCIYGALDATAVAQCIDALDAFNNDLDTLIPTPAVFAKPGSADPSQCKASRDDAFLYFPGV